MRVFFVRHGETNYNVKGLCNSDPSVDVHLTDRGKKEAEIVAKKLGEQRFDVVFVSELPRTVETAKLINDSAPVKVDKRINDRITGFEGRPSSEFHNAVLQNIANFKIGDGESLKEERERVLSFLEDLKASKHDSVLVVTHEEIMKVAKAYFEKLSDKELWDLHIDNCDVLDYEL